MDAASRREVTEELHGQLQSQESQQRYCRYALDILLDSVDRHAPEDRHDPDFESLDPDAREAYIEAQAARLGPALHRWVLGWSYTDLELVNEWQARVSQRS